MVYSGEKSNWDFGSGLSGTFKPVDLWCGGGCDCSCSSSWCSQFAAVAGEGKNEKNGLLAFPLEVLASLKE